MKIFLVIFLFIALACTTIHANDFKTFGHPDMPYTFLCGASILYTEDPFITGYIQTPFLIYNNLRFNTGVLYDDDNFAQPIVSVSMLLTNITAMKYFAFEIGMLLTYSDNTFSTDDIGVMIGLFKYDY